MFKLLFFVGFGWLFFEFWAVFGGEMRLVYCGVWRRVRKFKLLFFVGFGRLFFEFYGEVTHKVGCGHNEQDYKEYRQHSETENLPRFF
jgi:uncharacterized protein (UPF0128 family)